MTLCKPKECPLVPSGSPLVVFRVVREAREVIEVKKAGEVGEAWVVMVVFRVTD